MEIKFCGADREVTGSAHLITLEDGYTILLDCGLYQGYNKDMENFNEQWLFDPAEIDCMILSHAHIDHSGRIPKLVKDGFTGTIFCTHATRSLCAIMLLDSAVIQERDAEYYNKRLSRKKKNKKNRSKAFKMPLYTRKDVPEAMQYFTTLSYDHWHQIHENVLLEFKDAGHILGSASVCLQIKEEHRTVRIGFTGDIGRPDRPILRDPKPMKAVDYLISESTYGARDHEEKPKEIERFLRIIKETCLEKKGKLIIPAFSVGRTQEIVYMLDQLESAGRLPRIPVYVDSPLAVNATTVYGAHPECYDPDLQEYMLRDPNPFGFNQLTYIKEVADSKALNSTNQASIIISASGMMNAGRVKHHLFNSIDNKKNTILIVGYCSPGTPGAKLREGANLIKLFGEEKIVRADIETMDSFSAHADRTEMVDFLKNQKKSVKKLYLVHGQYESQQKFAELLKENGFKDVIIPELGDKQYI